MIEIREVNTKKELKEFASFPVKLYKDCPYYVPNMRSDELNTFNPKKNFSLKNNLYKGFVAYKDGKIVGRIAGLINKVHNEITGNKFIRFSRFTSIDDIEVFKALLGAVENFGKENGMEYIHGPWGFTDQDREGMLTYGFDRRSTYATEYFYPYYSKRMEELGFKPQSKWVEYDFTIPKQPYARVNELAKRIKQKLDLTELADVMPVRKIISKYGYKLFDAVNECYGHLDGYVPVEGDVVKNILAQFGTIVNKRYISILVDKNDDIAGFGVVLPSICEPIVKSRGKLFPTGFIGVLKNINRPKELEMALIGVTQKYKNSGVNSIVMSRIMNNLIEDGIEKIESNPMLETNLAIQQQWKFAESAIVKRRQTYVKKIGSLVD